MDGSTRARDGRVQKMAEGRGVNSGWRRAGITVYSLRMTTTISSFYMAVVCTDGRSTYNERGCLAVWSDIRRDPHRLKQLQVSMEAELAT